MFNAKYIFLISAFVLAVKAQGESATSAATTAPTDTAAPPSSTGAPAPGGTGAPAPGGPGAPQVPACVLDCVTSSLTAGGCTSAADLQCVCTSAAFQTAAQACLAKCTPEELAAALQLQAAQCAGISSGTASGSKPASSGAAPATSKPATTTSAPAKPDSTSAAASGSAKPSGAAMAKFQFGYGGVMGGAIACIGAVAGAFFVL